MLIIHQLSMKYSMEIITIKASRQLFPHKSNFTDLYCHMSVLNYGPAVYFIRIYCFLIRLSFLTKSS